MTNMDFISSGAAVHRDFLTPEAVDSIKTRLTVFPGEELPSPANQAVLRYTPRQILQLGVPVNRVKRQLLQDLTPRGQVPVLLQAWHVTSTGVGVSSSELPYVPHFDQDRRIKVMLYLANVEVKDGPISFIKVSVADLDSFEHARIRLAKQKKADSGGHEHGNVVKMFGAIPVTGGAGTAIVFDTNNPHLAGVPEVGGKREVFRLDFRLHSRRHLRPRILSWARTHLSI